MPTLSSLSPQIIIHLAAALSAAVLGPFALWARLSGKERPKLHRAFGYAWVTMMLATAISALFIVSKTALLWHFSWIHLLIPVVLSGLFSAFWFLAHGNTRGHRKTMVGLYYGACLGAGVFTLLPSRFLGQIIWG